MKKVIPFKKEIKFKTNVFEIVSISLDHELKLEDKTVVGSLIISGSYKINDISVNVEEFKFNIPVNIEMSDKYVLDNINIDIEDFYYEVINNNILSVDIEVSIDNIEEVKNPIIIEEEVKPVMIENNQREDYSDVTLENFINETSKPVEDKISVETKEVSKTTESKEISIETSLFSNFDDSKEEFETYKIYIVKENDTLESIVTSYNVSDSLFKEYNDITDIKVGDKLIIPSIESNI
jgi:LysM repeat protein